MKQQAEVLNLKRRSIPHINYIYSESCTNKIYENEVCKKIKLNNSAYQTYNRNNTTTYNNQQLYQYNPHLYNSNKSLQDSKQSRQNNNQLFDKNIAEEEVLSLNKANFDRNLNAQRNIFQSEDELKSYFIIEEHKFNYWEDLRQDRQIYNNYSQIGQINKDEFIIDFSGNKQDQS